jgi:hypothetical protein
VPEISGKPDDPEYIKGLDKSKFLDAHENVFAFNSHPASMEVLQMLTLFIAPSGIDDVGQQLSYFVLGTIDIESMKIVSFNLLSAGVILLKYQFMVNIKLLLWQELCELLKIHLTLMCQLRILKNRFSYILKSSLNEYLNFK